MSDLTLNKIAELAGVSRSTVSRVVNNQPNVSDDVRNRVQKIIQKTGYKPNIAARSLRSKQTNIIGLVIPEKSHTLFTDPYFSHLIQGVAQACNQNDKTLALILEADIHNLYPKVAHPGHLDGVLLQVGKIDNPLLKMLCETRMPFIVLGRPSVSQVSYIDVDNVAGAYMAVIHLISLGYRRIATITGALDTTAGLDRAQGYKNAIHERGLTYDKDLIAEADFTAAGGYYAARKLLPRQPDAIFAASDTMARGAIKALAEAGLSVPQDIALVGYDDLPPARLSSPLLTTVRQPVRGFGAKAVEILLDIIEYGPSPARQIKLDIELVIRESCGSRFAENHQDPPGPELRTRL